MAKLNLYNGLEFEIPKQPAREQIAGFDLPKKDQRWSRIPFPENWEELPEEEQERFAFEEDRKCTEGYWFYCNGTPTYITGDHYHYVNWFMIDSGYPEYRDRDRRWFYHWSICDNDPECLGQAYGKLRRDGYSYRVVSIQLNRARKTFNAKYGIVSKTGEDAKEMFNKLVHGFLEYPAFFKPQVQSAEDVKKALWFKVPQQRVTYKNRTTKKEISLNTLMDWKNTKENAYDGTKQQILAADECFGRGTKILCEGLVFKNIEDIKTGENIITEGGKLIEVSKTCYGTDDMFLVKQPYGKDFICNSQHRLYLEQRTRSHGAKDQIIKISPVEYLKLSKYYKKTTYRVTSKGIQFKEVNHVIDPYVFGAWIGDGHSHEFKIIVNKEKDLPIYDAIISYAVSKGIEYTIMNCDSKPCKYIYLKSNKINILDELRRLNVIRNKHIPSEYFQDSYENRLKLLAGIIDTDGFAEEGTFYICMKSKRLIRDIYNLCGTLGFSIGNIKEKKTNFNTLCYTIAISGDLAKIPTLVHRKNKRTYNKSYKSRRCKLDVEFIGKGEYFGITLKTENDDERRLILEDFTISMNTGKWLEANVEKWFNIGKTCLILGGKIIGKMFFGSTVNESEKGGKGFKSIWDRSLHSERTLNGRTQSGLYRYFVPAYDGMEGFIDSYGMSVIEDPEKPVIGIDGNMIKIGAKRYLEQELESKRKAGDVVGYYEQMRQFPITEDDMFRDPANESTSFDLDKIYEQIDYTSAILSTNSSLLTRGNLKWKNGVRDTEVEFHHDDKNGKWVFSWFPKLEDRNKKSMKFGKVCPANTHAGLFSIDPFDHKQTTSKKNSKAGSHGFRKLDLLDPEFSDCFISEYWGRPKDPHILYEDMILQCVFFGWEILGESNKPGCINYFRLRGYDNYLMMRPAITQTEYSEKNQDEPWLPTTGEAARGTLVENLSSYIYQRIGRNSENGKMGNCLFINTLKDWAAFDPEKWTDYDLTVSAMIAVVGSKKYVPKKVAIPSFNLFPQYKLMGDRSVLVTAKKT